MSAPAFFAASRVRRMASPEHGIAVVLLGGGVVGAALLRLLGTPAAAGLHLVGVANSRTQHANPRGLVPALAPRRLREAPAPRADDDLLAALDASGAARRVLVDATASEAVAARHARWLAAGCDVVSANKAALGGTLADWRALHRAARRGGARYGDAATVGAGLPVLSTLRRLRGCGDRLIALEGVFSGTLSWLFNRFDGTRPFSALVREARERGYAEPDPRIDLCGRDAARKLLILARVAGHAFDADAIAVEDLVPPALRDADVEAFLSGLAAADAEFEARRREAAARRRVLRHVARFDADGARVGVVDVDATHPAARLAGSDNLFALTTARYADRPLVIAGPGAGAGITAQALLGDLLALRDAAP